MCFKVQVKHCVISSFKAASWIDCIEDNEEHQPMAQLSFITSDYIDLIYIFVVFTFYPNYIISLWCLS